MIIKVDRNIYSDSCITKCIYWLSAKYTVQRTSAGDFEEIAISNVEDENAFEKAFWTMLNDYKLRSIIQEETKDIRTILYAKAFFNNDIEETDLTD